MPGWALSADFRVACVFPVTIPVGGAVSQGLVFWTDHAAVVFIIDVSPPGMSALSGHGTLVSSGQHPAIIKHFPADVRGLAGSVCHHGLCLGKGLGQFVVDIIKRHAVVDIAGGNHSLQYTAVLVAGTVSFAGKAPLMLSFVKQPTLRVLHSACIAGTIGTLHPSLLCGASPAAIRSRPGVGAAPV